MKIALLGDSQMQGLAPVLKPALEALGAEVIRVTANQGWSSSRYLGSGTLVGATSGADLVIAALGGNDDYGPDEVGPYTATLEAVRRQIAAPYVLWIGPALAMDTDTEARHAVTAELQRKIVPHLPGTTWLNSRPYTTAHWRSDGVHFTEMGYTEWSRAILDAYVWITTSPVVRAMYLGSFPLFIALRHVGG